MSERIDTEMVLDFYRRGVFPMADSREDETLFLISPAERGVLPLRGFHIPRRLKRTVRQMPYKVTVDTAFNRVIDACAEEQPDRPTTWINTQIQNIYGALHREGHAHSIECWNDEGQLVGGLYGVKLGAAFFGESMFSRATDASKIALVHLVARLIEGGFDLLDAQFHNPHLEQFGLQEIPKAEFMVMLKAALSREADFYSSGAAGVDGLTGERSVHLITQTS
ncbi:MULTISPECIES: leucyl/phenylalanyl-tRNA--protein transferase [Henriciella]|jgi:leucyl/phenylalanyl-tRNA---protein transferase|uniref:Leucyl/phenylalanyl-tRNA--protein transferase n=1 Tax=Henriciella pelagia TaxID=1977912 RepID=A0ABQ1J851_9PROT|nr:leucyl/phenylalanyl-tRNA--protein transferase [Henriciella pelagia]GGB61007.1 leucyl/phenylalanyl-tRNA--protein transferase [Henriciella pelagia]